MQGMEITNIGELPSCCMTRFHFKADKSGYGYPAQDFEILMDKLQACQNCRLECTVRDVEAPPLTTEVPAQPPMPPPSQALNGGPQVGFPTSRRVEFSPTRYTCEAATSLDCLLNIILLNLSVGRIA